MINKLIEKLKNKCSYRSGAGSDAELHPKAYPG